MKKICPYCQRSFTAQRATKLYCCDNCRQMAYLCRKGFTVTKDSGASIHTETEGKGSNSVKYSPAVKYSNTEHGVKYSQQETETLAQHIQKEARQIDNNTITPHLTVKYTNEKPTVKYSNSEHSIKYTRQESNTPPEHEETPAVTEKSNSEPEPITKREALQNKLKLLTLAGEQKIAEEIKAPERYEWVEAVLFQKIEAYTGQINKHPDPYLNRHWEYDKVKIVTKVNEQLRYLLEGMLIASNCGYSKTEELVALANGFIRLYNSANYKDLPQDYCYTGLIEELTLTLHKLLRNNSSGGTHIKIKLQRRRKIQLLVIRNLLVSFTAGRPITEQYY